MNRLNHPHLSVAVALGALLTTLTLAAHGQSASGDWNVAPATAHKQADDIARGDPPRWFREDRTPQERLHTAQKEIGAALEEARQACRHGPAAARDGCLKEARAVYQQDMAAAKVQSTTGR